MHAIPLRLSAELEVTGLACPDCSGVLAARVEGRNDSLAFECRVGHTYDVSELLQAKEEVLEERLWSAATALRELKALLHDLERRSTGPAGCSAAREAFRRRATRVGEQAEALTRILRANLAIDVSSIEPEAP